MGSELRDLGTVDLVVRSIRSINDVSAPNVSRIQTKTIQSDENLARIEATLVQTKSDLEAWTDDLNLSPIDKKALIPMLAKIYSDTECPPDLGS